jgi:hypothetical protein
VFVVFGIGNNDVFGQENLTVGFVSAKLTFFLKLYKKTNICCLVRWCERREKLRCPIFKMQKRNAQAQTAYG